MTSAQYFFAAFQTRLYITILLLIMSLTSFGCAFTFYYIRDKQASDWKNITFCERIVGLVCKEFPFYNRIKYSRVFSLSFGQILVAIGVCRYERDSFNQVSFYNDVRGLLHGTTIGGIIMFLGGTIFHYLYPPDTALSKPVPAASLTEAEMLGQTEVSCKSSCMYTTASCCHICMHHVGP